MSNVAIIQARMGSTRLPGKMSMEIANHPIISWVIKRVKKSKKIDGIYLATTNLREDDFLEKIGLTLGIKVYRGSELNVLSRYSTIFNKLNPNYLIRICADNPLISSSQIDKAINYIVKNDFDYVFNHIPFENNNYVDGVGAEVLNSNTCKTIFEKSYTKEHLEHVTKYIYENREIFKFSTIKAPIEYSYPNISLDIDTIEDFDYLKNKIEFFMYKNNLTEPEEFNEVEFLKYF